MTKRSAALDLLGWAAHHRVVLLSILRFVVALVVATAVLTRWGSTFFPAMERAVAWLMGIGLRALGMDAVVTGAHVQTHGFSMVIISECTGIFPTLIFVIGVLAAPFRWRQRVFGILIGVTTLMLLNCVRMVSLAVVGVRFPAQFDTIHLVVWQPLFVFAAAMLWLAWALRSHRHGS